MPLVVGAPLVVPQQPELTYCSLSLSLCLSVCMLDSPALPLTHEQEAMSVAGSAHSTAHSNASSSQPSVSSITAIGLPLRLPHKDTHAPLDDPLDEFVKSLRDPNADNLPRKNRVSPTRIRGVLHPPSLHHAEQACRSVKQHRLLELSLKLR